KWFKKNRRLLDPERHARYQVELARGSEALRDIFSRKGKFYETNDTSAAVGYAPLTNTEKIVLHTERYINSPSFKKEFPETGEDVKIMGSREGRDLNLTIAMAFVDRLIENENQYFQRKAEVVEDVTRFVKSRVKFDGVNVDINTLDKRGRGMGGIYLTVLGTSADDGDGGQVGRGNRVNGVIPLNRPTCSEAAAGKNPVSHVGKIYNLLTYEIAQHVHQKVPGVREVYVWLLSQIGMASALVTSTQLASDLMSSSGRPALGAFYIYSRDTAFHVPVSLWLLTSVCILIFATCFAAGLRSRDEFFSSLKKLSKAGRITSSSNWLVAMPLISCGLYVVVLIVTSILELGGIPPGSLCDPTINQCPTQARLFAGLAYAPVGEELAYRIITPLGLVIPIRIFWRR